MCGGGSGGQLKPITTSTTTADPRAQAMYQQAFGTAQQAAQTPFMRYSTDPRAFVAQLTPTQQQAISNIAQSQGVYQPYYGAAAGLAGGAGTTSTADIVGQYMSPYMRQVVDPVRAALEQQQGMQLSQQQAEAIKGGAFGGERAGLQRAALRGQQQLGMGQALSPLYQTGYGQALGAAQGDLARQLQAGQVMGGLGTGAQQAAMQGAQGLLGAGTLQQQTEQAGRQALYNQFLMERGYPFQTSQFLTSAAAGLGPLYGGTTVEQQAVNPFGQFLSDPRAKTGVDREEPDVVGKLNDGQNVYAYKYAAGGPAQIGLMADEVAQRYPDAVGQRPDGLMTVDYGRATEVPAAMSHGLGAARMGGAVTDGGDYARGGYAAGGDIEEIVARHKAALAAGVPTKMDIPTGAVQASQGLQPAKMSGSRQQEPESLAGLLGKGAAMGESASKLAKTYDFFKERFSGKEKPYEVSAWPGWGGNKAYGGPTSLDIPTEAIRASRGLEPARISGSGREEEDDGFLGGLSKAADIGSKLAGIGTLAMKAAPFVMSLSDPRAKTGVRHGYADRGAVPTEDDVFERGLLGAESAHRQFDKEGRTLTSPKGALGIAQIMPGTAPEAAKLAGLEYDPIRLRQDPEYNKALGKAYFDEQRRRFGSDELAAAAYNAGPGRVQRALRQAEATGRDVMSFLPAETRAYVPKVVGRGAAEGQPLAYTSIDRPGGEGGLGAINRVADRGSLRAEAAPPAEAGLGAARTPGEEPGFMDKYMKEEYVVPGLIGLAGAVEGALSAPTTSLGAALARGAATGVGAGAKAYEDIQTALPTREKIKAEQELLRSQGLLTREQAGKIPAETFEIMQRAKDLGFKNFGSAENPDWRIQLEDGSWKTLYDWDEAKDPIMGGPAAAALAKQLQKSIATTGSTVTPASRVPPGPAGTPVGPEPLPGATEGIEAPKLKPAIPPVAPKAVILPGVVFDEGSAKAAAEEVKNLQRSADKPAIRQKSRDYIERTNRDAASAYERKIFNNEMADIISKASSGKLLAAPGPGYEFTATVIGALNRAVRSIPGLAVEENFFGDAKEYSDIMNKLTTLQAQAVVKGAGQEAVGALIENMKALPGLSKEPGAAAHVAASNMVATQKSIDRNIHADQWGRFSRGIYSGAMNDFESKNDNAKYAQEQDALRRLLLDRGDREKRIAPGNVVFELMKQRKISPDQIDEYFETRYNIPKERKMSRYFQGAR